MESYVTPENIRDITETLKMLGEITASRPNELLPVYAALGGAIAGAIASFFPTFLLERYRERARSRRLLFALIAEISAMLQVLNQRKYLQSIQDIIKELADQPPEAKRTFQVYVPDHYSRIYQTNCGNIGEIDTIFAKDIVIFHQLIDAVVQDVRPGGNSDKGATIKLYREIEGILSQAIKIGDGLVKKWSEKYN